MATTRNLASLRAVGSGPTMSIPHWEKGHAEVIDVISYFGFLGPTYRIHGDRYDLWYRLLSIILYWVALILSFMAFFRSLGSVLNRLTSIEPDLKRSDLMLYPSEGVLARKFANIWPLTVLHPLNSIPCSPSCKR
ncbi:hypothetical protein Tco_0356678, partial [Tanacetum coccineum]